MASSRYNSAFIVVIFHIICGILCFSSSAASECNLAPEFWCDTAETAAACDVTNQCERLTHSKHKKVDVGFYYESLCPGCKYMFSHQLGPAFDKIGSIMDVELVPYGNAREQYNTQSKHWQFRCQHGHDECVGNLIETCAISLLKNITTYFPYIACIERSTQLPAEAAPKCAREMKINYSPILACSKSARGNQLEHEMAAKTEALKPDHKYVPWFTINGVHTEQLQNEAMANLISLVCKTFTGSPKPAACNGGSENEWMKSYR